MSCKLYYGHGNCSFAGQFFYSLTVGANDPVLFNEQGQVGDRLVESEQDDAQLIQSGVHCRRYCMKIAEHHSPRLAREYDVANSLVAEVVNPLVPVDCSDALQQIQRLAMKADSRMALIQQTLNRIDAWLCSVSVRGCIRTQSRSFFAPRHCIRSCWACLQECLFQQPLIIVGVHATSLVRLRVVCIQKSGMTPSNLGRVPMRM